MMFTLASAAAAISLRNIMHCTLAVALTFLGIAGVFVVSGAEFVGFAQVLIYIGAVGILLIFAILLTRSDRSLAVAARGSLGGWAGIAVAIGVFAVLAVMIAKSELTHTQSGLPAHFSVLTLGNDLMTRYVVPLEILGLLLTAAMIGAVILAMRERPRK